MYHVAAALHSVRRADPLTYRSSSFPGPRGSRLAVPTYLRLGTPNPYTQWPMGRNASVAERGTADPKYLDGIADSYWSQRLRLVGG